MRRLFLIFNLSLIFLFFAARYSFSSSPKLRVISLAPSTTEILFALGLDDEITGVSQYCNYPPKALSKEKVGTFSQANIEKVLLLKPDIIFCTGLEQAPIITKLKQLNLRVYISDPSNFKELFDSIREIGRLVNKEGRAVALIAEMKAGIEKITSKVKLIPQERRPKVFVEIWHSPLMTAGRGSFIDELLGLAGGVNIAYDTQRPYSYFSPEQVIKRDPDCIILAYMDKESPLKIIKGRFGWNNISAVKNNRIYNDINPDALLRPGPRLVEALEEIYERLYP
ncbi:MAG: cobalamin-binding protein [Candidatus Omnitrophica bacterium]|nr:cobalamin-binding protein [Candidatus Omnitrophota bacterium]